MRIHHSATFVPMVLAWTVFSILGCGDADDHADDPHAGHDHAKHAEDAGHAPEAERFGCVSDSPVRSG